MVGLLLTESDLAIRPTLASATINACHLITIQIIPWGNCRLVLAWHMSLGLVSSSDLDDTVRGSAERIHFCLGLDCYPYFSQTTVMCCPR